MQIKKYCLIAFIDEKLSKILKEEIKSISNEAPSYAYIKNNFFITFTSAFELGEIENLLSEHDGLVFFLFINEEKNLIYNLPDRIKGHLFDKFCVKQNKNKVEILVQPKTKVKYIDVDIKILKQEPIVYSQEEKIKLIDEILDKGLENINEEEKNILNALFNNNKVGNINK
jgi:hypothetical protein